MDRLHVLHDRVEQLHAFTLRQGALSAHNVILEGNALHKIHDEIGGVIGIEHVPDFDNIVQVAHAHGLACFAYKALTGLACFIRRDAGAPIHHGSVGAAAHGSAVGEKLLDANAQFKLQIVSDISQAEAALSQQTPDEIASVQNAAAGQRKIRLLSGALPIVVTAVTAYAVFLTDFFHAGIAAQEFHSHLRLSMHRDRVPYFYLSAVSLSLRRYFIPQRSGHCRIKLS